MIVLVEAGLAVFLVARRADFGVFKLTMYAQPFLAAAAAAWLAEQRTRVPAIAAGSAARPA